MCRGGQNGLSLILMSLVWWYNLLDGDVKDSDDYTKAVVDLIWVLEILVNGKDDITWLEDNVLDTARRASKRTATDVPQTVVPKVKRYLHSLH